MSDFVGGVCVVWCGGSWGGGGGGLAVVVVVEETREKCN